MDKLELLKEYLSDSIENRFGFVWIDPDAIPEMEYEKIINLWDMTGILFFRKDTPTPSHSNGRLSFEGWIKDKKEQTDTLKSN